MIAQMILIAVLAVVCALAAAYLLGEAVGSRRGYEPVLSEELTVEQLEFLPESPVHPDEVPVVVVSTAEIESTAQVAVDQTRLAKRYRAEARRLRRNSTTQDSSTGDSK